MKSRINTLKILAIASLVLLATSAFQSAEKTGTVSGIVTDAATHQPVPGASVIILGTKFGTVTSVSGEFAIKDVPVGRHSVQISHSGFQSELHSDVEVCDGCNVRLELSLTISGEIDELSIEPIRQFRENEAVRKMGVADVDAYLSIQPSAARTMLGREHRRVFNTEEYAYLEEAGFLNPRMNPLSTFSIDVDAASYSNMRRFINNSSRPPIDAIRTEELVNYFDYDYPQPGGNHPVAIYTELNRAPWNPDNLLLHIGLQAEELAEEDVRPSNLVFLLDVSGSMDSPDKLGLLKKSFGLLVSELGERDTVSIVVYAGAAGLVLPPTRGDRTEEIFHAIDHLEAGGSTAGGAGIQLAYKVASRNLIRNGNNRVILATDGDFNVGVSATGDLVRLITDKKKEGIGLTVLGFGGGNLKDSRMESLADNGDGNYYYIDSILEGKKVFVDQLRSTLYTVAKDVKVQVEFNPAVVGSYRLIGYENRALNAEDFVDDKKDAGEMGSGHTVTALYEIELTGSGESGESGDLRYQNYRINSDLTKELGLVKIRYKTPQGVKSTELNAVVANVLSNETTNNFDFSASVAMFSMLLRDSMFMGETTADRIVELARAATGDDSFGYRAEFIRLVETFSLMDLADARHLN